MVNLNDGTSVSLEEFNSWHFNKQHAKTRPLEELREIRKKASLINQREVSTPFGIFKSIRDAVNKTDMTFYTLRSKIFNESENEYYFTKSKPEDESKKFNKVIKIINKETVTPLGTFKSKAKAAEAHGLNKSTFGRLMTANPMEYYLLSEGPKEKEIDIKVKKLRIKKEPKKKLTKEERKVIALKVGFKKRKAINTPKGKFTSLTEAVKALGITKDALRSLCLNTAYPLYSYVNPTAKDIANQFHRVYKAGPKVTVTPIGTYATKGLAAKALGISFGDLDRLIRLQPKKYYYFDVVLKDSPQIIPEKNYNHPTKSNRLSIKYMTPTGPYPSKSQACNDYGLSAKELDHLIKNHPKDFYKIKKINQSISTAMRNLS